MLFPVICVPTAGRVHAHCTHSIVTTVAMLLTVRMLPDEQEQRVDYKSLISGSTLVNREGLVDLVLENKKATHLLFVDDDMKFSPDAVAIMIRRRMPVVLCNYTLKKDNARFMAKYLDHSTCIVTRENSVGLEPCEYAGFGLSLIAREVLEKMKKPRFLPFWSEKEGGYSTEDKPFFDQVRSLGYTVWVDHDASKLVRHVGDKEYDWKESSTYIDGLISRVRGG